MLSVVSLSGEHIIRLNIDELTVAEPHAAAVSVIKQCIRSEKHISIFRLSGKGWILWWVWNLIFEILTLKCDGFEFPKRF